MEAPQINLPQLRADFAKFCRVLVKNSIKRDGTQIFAPLPNAAAGWPIDDLIYNKFLDLVVDESSAFLAEITMERGFDTTQGNILRHDLSGGFKRTVVDDTVRRMPTIVGSSSAELFNLQHTEFDSHLPYNELAHWLKRGQDFLANIIRTQMAKKFGNDLLQVGFNGTSDVAAPVQADLSDFGKGWIQLVRDNAAANIISEVVTGSSKIFIGKTKTLAAFDATAAVDETGGVTSLPATGHGFKSGANLLIAGTTNYDGQHLVLPASTADRIFITAAFVAEADMSSGSAVQQPDYASLDALVVDLRNSIQQELRAALKAIVSETVFNTEEEALYAEMGRTPTEKIAIRQSLSTVANLDRLSPNAMPAGMVIVTPPLNLNIYFHETFNRRMEDKPELNGFVMWNDTWIDWIVEDYRRVMIAENVDFI